MDRTDNWCIGVGAGSLWANIAKIFRGDASQVHDRWGGDIIYHISRYSLECQVLLTLKRTD